MVMVGTTSLGAIPPWPHFADFLGEGLLIPTHLVPVVQRVVAHTTIMDTAEKVVKSP